MSRNRTYRQYLTGFVASLSAVCGGSSYTWVTPVMLWLLSPQSEILMTNLEASWIVNAIELGDLVTPIPIGFIVDKIGRKPLLISMGPLYTFTWVLALATSSVHVLYIVRFIQGMVLGIGNSVLPMYLGEIAEPKIRGSIGIYVQSMWYLGIVFSFIVGAFFKYRDLIWIMLIVPIIFTAAFVWFPESPYYLLMTGNENKAAEALMWLRNAGGPEGVTEELQEMKSSLAEERRNRATWRDLVATKEGRMAILMEQAVVVTALMGGIAPILTYAPVIFSGMTGEDLHPQTYTLIMGALVALLAPFSGLLLDKLGRRPVLLVSTSLCSAFLVFSGVHSYLSLRTSIDVSDYTWASAVSLILYLIVISCGVEAVFPVLQSELFSNSTRALASAVTTMVLTLVALLSLVVYQTMNQAVGIYGCFFLFSFFCFFGFLVIFKFLPETKGKTFDEIQKLLS